METWCGRKLFRLLPKSTWVLISFVLRIHHVVFFSNRFRVQTVATAMHATGGAQITPHRTHARAHFSRYVPHFAQFIQCTKVFERSFACFSKVIPSATMPLLGVPEFTSFLPVFALATTTPTPRTGIRLNPCATPLWGGPSGHLADPTPNTGYEPKFCINVSSERTPINLPTRKSGFPLESDAVDTSSRKLAADYDSVASQTRSRTLAADVDHETSVRSVFESVSKEKKDRDFNVVQTLRDRQNLHKNLERKAESAARGEKLVQQRLFGAEADVEVNHWEKRNSDIALHEINQEFESQRFQLQQANHWDDQA